MVRNGDIVPLLRSSSSTLTDFPIYRDLPMLQLDVKNMNVKSPYPVSSHSVILKSV